MNSSQPLSRREQRKQEIRHNILRHSHALFVKQGYEQTTINDILKAAGIARGTFFFHFPSKSELLAVLAAEMIRITREKALEIARQDSGVEHKIQAFFKHCIDQTKTADDFSKLLISYSFSTIHGHENVSENTIDQGIKALLSDAYQQDLLDQRYSLDVLTQTVHGIFSGLILNWINQPNFPLDERRKQAAELAVKAISP